MIMKLKPNMLKMLNIKVGTTYYACSEEVEIGSIDKSGKRARWADSANLLVNSENLVSKSLLSDIDLDHTYNMVEGSENESDENVDIATMGQEFFLDSGTLDYHQETVEDEVDATALGLSCSQVHMCAQYFHASVFLALIFLKAFFSPFFPLFPAFCFQFWTEE